MRIEEITDPPQPQAIRALISPEHLQIRSAIGIPLFPEIDELKGDVETCKVRRRKPRVPTQTPKLISEF